MKARLFRLALIIGLGAATSAFAEECTNDMASATTPGSGWKSCEARQLESDYGADMQILQLAERDLWSANYNQKIDPAGLIQSFGAIAGVAKRYEARTDAPERRNFLLGEMRTRFAAIKMDGVPNSVAEAWEMMHARLQEDNVPNRQAIYEVAFPAAQRLHQFYQDAISRLSAAKDLEIRQAASLGQTPAEVAAWNKVDRAVKLENDAAELKQHSETLARRADYAAAHNTPDAGNLRRQSDLEQTRLADLGKAADAAGIDGEEALKAAGVVARNPDGSAGPIGLRMLDDLRRARVGTAKAAPEAGMGQRFAESFGQMSLSGLGWGFVGSLLFFLLGGVLHSRRTGASMRDVPFIALAMASAVVPAYLLIALIGALFGLHGWVSFLMFPFAYGVIVRLIFRVAIPALRRRGLGAFLPGGKDSNSHGSSRWSFGAEMRAAGHLLPAPAPAFALGRALEAARDEDSRFRYTGHVVTVAPTRSGKGVGAVIPNLLEYPGSALVVDIKGENYAVTARSRRAMGHEVYLVDPFNVTGETGHSFNWLDRIDPDDPDVVGESAAIAEMMFIVNKNDEGNFWDDSGKELLRGLLIYAAGLDEPMRNVCTVRNIVTSNSDEFDSTLALMANSSAGFGVVAKAANGYMSLAERTRGDVLAAVRRHTQFLDDPRIAKALSQSDFRLADIKTKLMTVYIVLPPPQLKPQCRFVRVFIGQTLSALTAAGTAKPAHNVGFFIDEFGQLGYMAAIEDAISLVGGYGVAFWLFIQDLSQLKGVYPKWQTFLANSAKQFFGTADIDTAKYVSESLGQFTVNYSTANRSNHMLKLHEGSGGSSDQVAGRSLLTPDEVMRLQGQIIVLIRGEAPHLLQPLNYLVDGEYAGKFDPNPYHQ